MKSFLVAQGIAESRIQTISFGKDKPLDMGRDEAAWAPRIKTGLDALVQSALKGKGAMAAQGGGEFSDFEIGRAVVYMANDGGAKQLDKLLGGQLEEVMGELASGLWPQAA